MLEALHGARPRGDRLSLVAERHAVRADRRDRALGADADGSRTRGDHPSDPAEAEHGERRGAHVS
jgi:hypothetical protein